MAWVAVKAITSETQEYWLDEEGYVILDETNDPIYD